MNDRIMITTADIGWAHINRVIAVAKELDLDGYELHFCLSRKNCVIARQNGFRNIYPTEETSWIENEYGVDVVKSLYNVLLPTNGRSSIIQRFVSQYRAIREYMHRINPKLLISDGSIPALRVSKRWNKDCIFITNTIRPSYPWYAQVATKVPQEMAERYMQAAREIIFADLPPNKTISLYNLGDSSKFDNLKFVGPFTDMRLPSGVRDGGFIYVMSSGTSENRKRFSRRITPILDRHCNQHGYTWKMTLGLSGGLMEKTDLHEIYGYADSETHEKFQKECGLMFHNGSHSICFRAISKEKRSLIVPTKHQVEQEANARRMQELGLGVCLEEKRLEQELPNTMEALNQRKAKYSSTLREFRECAERFDGLREAVEDIESFA